MPDKNFNQNQDEQDESNNEDTNNRRKRRSSNLNQTDEFISFCSRYAKSQKSLECEKMIPGAYTLGTGFDIKYENGENSRRKSVILRYCNYQK